MTFNDNQCYPLFYFVQNKSRKDVMADLIDIDKLIGCGPGKERLTGKKFWTQFALQFNITTTFSRRPEGCIPCALSIGISMFFTIC